MTILTRYLLRAHLGPFVFAFVALTGLLIVNTVVRELARLQGKGIPGEVILEFFVLSLPPVVALTLPMAVLVSVLYTFSQMASENEITALKASGVDLRRAALPLVLVAALIAVGMVWFNDRVLPATNHRLSALMVDIMQTSPLLAFREQAVNPIQTADGAAYLQAGRIDAGSGRMRDVTIYDPRAPDVNRTIYADSGRMALSAARTDLVLSLYDGHLRRLDFAQPDAFQQLGFRQYEMRFASVARRLERTGESGYRHDRSMTVAMMRSRVDSLRAEVRRLEAGAGEPLPPSAGVAEQERGATAGALRREARTYQVEIHKKYSIAAATLVFVLVGIPLALRFPYGGIGMVIAVSVPIFALYYVGLEGGESLADAGHVDPGWAMWVVNLLMALGGAVALLRLGRERGTGRGGGGVLSRLFRAA